MDSLCRIIMENKENFDEVKACCEERRLTQPRPSPLTEKASYVLEREDAALLGETSSIASYTLAKSQTDFKRTKLVGEGGYGKVFQVLHHGKVYAMKVVKKLDTPRFKTQLDVEKHILGSMKSSFLCQMFQHFETEENVYFILEFFPGGDFQSFLEKEEQLEEDLVKFYLAQILLALEYLHDHEIIYRDLKPSNILMDHRGYLKLTDFGLCKLNVAKGQKTSTICGTLEYYAPEQVKKRAYDHSVDLWALGVLMYLMVMGHEPFSGESRKELQIDIIRGKPPLPKELSRDGKELLKGLLTRVPENRITVPEAKNLNFFNDIDWKKLEKQECEMPLKPNIDDPMDSSNFDSFFTGQEVECSPREDERDPFEEFDFEV